MCSDVVLRSVPPGLERQYNTGFIMMSTVSNNNCLLIYEARCFILHFHTGQIKTLADVFFVLDWSQEASSSSHVANTS